MDKVPRLVCWPMPSAKVVDRRMRCRDGKGKREGRGVRRRFKVKPLARRFVVDSCFFLLLFGSYSIPFYFRLSLSVSLGVLVSGVALTVRYDQDAWVLSWRTACGSVVL